MPRVIYIEDNADNRMLVRRILMAYNIDVDEADNAPDGIKLALQNPPDMISLHAGTDIPQTLSDAFL